MSEQTKNQTNKNFTAAIFKSWKNKKSNLKVNFTNFKTGDV